MIRVVKPGMLTTVQDLGRFEWVELRATVEGGRVV
jgi:allophanate hydrolase subunit 2